MVNEAAAVHGEWVAAKLLLEELTGVSKDALHVLIGLVAVVAVAAILRRSLASALPALVVLALELLNEAVDLTMETWPDRPMWPGSVKDVVLTMAAPIVLLAAARWIPSLFLPTDQPVEGPEPSDPV